MDRRYSNLMFLLGIAPLALACETQPGNSNGEDETDGGDESDSESGDPSSDTTDESDEDSSDSPTGDGDGDGDDPLCGPYAEIYGGCDSLDQQQYVYEFCQYVHEHFQTYASEA